jgi:hypothetical protein
MNVSGVNLDQSMSKTFYAPESPYPVQNPIAAVTNQVTNQVKNIFSTVSNVVKGARNTNRNTDDDDGYGYDNDDDDLPQVGEEVEVCDDDEPSVWELGTVESISDTGDVYVRKAGWNEAFVYDSWRFPVTSNNDQVEDGDGDVVEEVSASRQKSPSKKDKEKAKKVSAPIVVRCLLHEDALKEKDKNLTEIGFDVECDRNLPVSVCVCV